MVNLTVDEARARAAAISVRRYDIELDLSIGEAAFASRSRIAFESRDGGPTFFEVMPDQLTRVELDGVALDVAQLRDGRFPIQPRQGAGELLIEATMAYSHDGEGLHRTVDPEDKRAYVYAMTFLDAAPRVFGCFDQPDLKAEVAMRVKVPGDWIVLGNARAAAEDPDTDGNRWWSMHQEKPLSTYFTTLVAGPYHSVEDEHDGIRLGLHCRQSLGPHLDKDAEELFRLTAQCFDEYHRLFGIRYPFGDYHQVFCPEFNAGAMENPGCVTFNDELVFRAQATRRQRSDRANTVAHEMAHQWFGDLVTMTWWDDLWLNESFADYMGHRVCVDATDFTDNWLLFALLSKAWGLDADQRSTTHPVAGNEARDAHAALTNFDGISYSKGAVALRQMRNYLGEEAFIAGIVDHLQRHSYANASLADLIGSWEAASGRDLSDWVHGWLRTSGIDTLAVRQGDPTVVARTSGAPVPVSRAHAISVTAYGADGRATTVPVVVDQDETSVALDSSAPGTVVLPDSGDESWVKIGFDADAVDALPELIPSIEDVVSRAAIWGALRDGLLDARVSPDAYLRVVEAALPREDDDLVLERVLLETALRSGSYLHTPRQLRQVEALAGEILTGARPESNRQLVAARAVLQVSTDRELLRSWLDGDAPEGLLMDSDMRWRALERLCALGGAAADDIESATAADPSSQGAVAALRCRAALPGADTKEAVWRTITADAEISNTDVYALCGSFFQPSQPEVVAPYLTRFFTEVPGTARLRNGMAVQLSCMRLFPDFAPDDEVLAAADAALARDDLDPFVRRAFSDGTDDLRRLRASRSAFAGT